MKSLLVILLSFLSFLLNAQNIDSLEYVLSRNYQKDNKLHLELLRAYHEDNAHLKFDSLQAVLLNRDLSSIDSADVILLEAQELSNRASYVACIEKCHELIEKYQKLFPDLLHKPYRILGTAHYYLENYKEAIKSWKTAIKFVLANNLGKPKLADTYINIGSAMTSIKELDSADHYFKKALKIYESENLLQDQAITRINMANAFAQRARLDTSRTKELLQDVINQYIKAEEIILKSGDSSILGAVYANIGFQFEHLKSYKKSNFYFKKALEISEKYEDLQTQSHIFSWLAENYAELGMYKEAYESFAKYSFINDSLINSDRVKNAAEMEAKFQNLQMEKEIKIVQQEADLHKLNSFVEKEKAKREEQKRKSRTLYLYFAIAGLVLFFGLAFMFFRGKQNQQAANIVLKEAYDQIEIQRDEIRLKNKNITDSIEYAKRLQDAILPSSETLSEGLKDHFVLFKPRDVVSGDFYWYAEKDDYVFIAAADCTGHGVPGAFVSMSCNNLLDNVLIEKNTTDPGEILSKVHLGIIGIYKRKESISQANDGMDIVICRFNKKTKELHYAAAMNPLYQVSNGEIIEHKTDRRGLGGIAQTNFSFTSRKVDYHAGDVFYISTDGIQDQFGGSKGKKLKKKKFKEMLLNKSEMPMSSQASKFDKEIVEWQGDREQLDDILLIGFKL